MVNRNYIRIATAGVYTLERQQCVCFETLYNKNELHLYSTRQHQRR
jgi:hypothetical protein